MDVTSESSATRERATFLAGGGEMGALMRATDWAATPLGPIDLWPQSLRTTVSTCLNSRFPILIWWGPQFVKLYNDAYREVIAAKHPHALGRPGREVWPEIWHIIGPMLESVVNEGRATWSEDQFLPLERLGFAEECYFTFSYSPIRDESGHVGGVFSAVTETTRRVIGERRLKILQELAAETPAATTVEVCARAAAILSRDPADVPFALLYLLDDDGQTLRLAAMTDTSLEPALAPPVVSVRAGTTHSAWPFERALQTSSIVVEDGAAGGSLRAFVAPILASQDPAVGVLVAGISPMLAVDEQYRGFTALVAREIGGSLSHARALEDERRRAEALAEIDRAKTVFFSNVSHEFRTPLTLLLGPVEDALTAADAALKGDDLATVHRNALRLMKLVNTLLDFARIEAGRAHLTFEPTDLGQLTADVASTFRSAMDRAGLSYDVRSAPFDGLVEVDREAWEKIVLNLLSNALKFTFEGGVAVTLEARADVIELCVRDTGVGIPPDQIPHLFERFHRVHGARARTHEGSGIGLALVNELVRMHDGSIGVTSRMGEGTAFTVSIPRRASERAAHRPHTASPETAARPYVMEALQWLRAAPDLGAQPHAAAAEFADAPRILLADDNADMREYVTRLLADRWTVEAVGDGRRALEAARACPPALVISDVMMPGVDGFELLRALRADPATREIPVILLSARAGEEASIEGLGAGADDYIVKPFSARELCARVDAQLLRARIRTAQAAHDRRVAEVFRHAPVAVALLRGADHVFEFANEQYVAVTGGRDLLGKRVGEALPEIAEQGIPALLDAVYRSGEPYAAEALPLTLNRGAGGAPELVYFNFVYQPMRNADGDVDSIAVVAVDVTELVRAREDAEAADRAKDQFLAVLGHELRNPLAPILTAIELLDRKGPDDPDLRRLRQTIARQARQMLRLVDDLLDVARIMTGKLRLDCTRTEVAAVVKQAVETSIPFIERHGHTLALTLPDAPLFFVVDGTRMTQVLCNLLNNAAKYMPRSGRVRLAASEESGWVTIRVRDEGVGIPRDMLDRVFDRFVQADPMDGASRVGGLGIGLSVVKTIVELHGGTVVALSDGPGTGSEFIVRIPATP